MLYLSLGSDSVAGTDTVARHFPFRIGRSEVASLRLERAGIWEQHVELNLGNGCVTIASCDQAPVRINGCQMTEPCIVHCGDLLELGSVKIIVGLSSADRRKDLLQQGVLAGSILGLTLAQGAIFWWLSNQ
jgi:hypothetical protein